MAIDSNIKTYTVADIEKYHNGVLSAKEMHAIEKAALDDPFLADALEGYAIAGTNAVNDIAELKKRLAERTETTKVVPIAAGGTSIPWLRIAAMIILVAGAGLLVYQFAFNEKKENVVAQNEAKEKEQVNAIPLDTAKKLNDEATVTGLDKASTTKGNRKEDEIIITNNGGGSVTTEQLNSNAIVVQKDSIALPGLVTKPETSAPLKNMKEKQNESFARGTVDIKNKELKAAAEKLKDSDGDGVTDDKDKTPQGNLNGLTREVALNKKENTNYQYKYNNSNVFRGRVLDNNNQALPFANITNTRDNVGTYSDANGFFTLTSPDSVLDVQVRSLGYGNNNYRLRNTLPGNQLVLQEDNAQLSEVVISNRRANSSRSRSNTMVLEEPEPVDGWENYDTYIANNVNAPEALKTKQTNGGEVEVTFEVDNNGNPINVTVSKSLCESCDKEAVRLVKEGPKFKRKAKKKGKTTVTVAF